MIEFYSVICWDNILKSLSANSTKWSNTLKQFVDNLPTNCLSVFNNFVKLSLKELKVFLGGNVNPPVTIEDLWQRIIWKISLLLEDMNLVKMLSKAWEHKRNNTLRGTVHVINEVKETRLIKNQFYAKQFFLSLFTKFYSHL